MHLASIRKRDMSVARLQKVLDLGKSVSFVEEACDQDTPLMCDGGWTTHTATSIYILRELQNK